MTLAEIEQAIQARIGYMAKIDESPIEDWMDAYRTLAQVKQAQASERIAKVLENWLMNGVPVERVP
jgi:hypothetical protein